MKLNKKANTEHLVRFPFYALEGQKIYIHQSIKPISKCFPQYFRTKMSKLGHEMSLKDLLYLVPLN